MSTKRLPALAALSFSLISLNAFSADLYVSVNNSKATDATSNLGTDPNIPLKTINRAAALAKSGTTVHVAAGTYYENIHNQIGGSATARIRFVSEPKWGAKVVGSGTEYTWWSDGSYVDIVNFDISGSGRLGIANNASHNLIQGNHVHNLTVSGSCSGGGGAGIDNTNYSGSGNQIIGNLVHDIGVPGACNGVQGIYVSDTGATVLNNIVYRASAYGIHLWHAANQVTVMNNTVFDNGSSNVGGGIVIGVGDSPGGVQLHDVLVANNIVYKNPGRAISEYCYDSAMSCIGSNITVTNNIVFGNGQAVYVPVGKLANSYSYDPSFVNYQVDGTGDFHLKGVSYAIDRGVSSSILTTDFDGNLRPTGPGYDIGAYEYQSTTAKPVLSLSANSMNFGNVVVGSTSASQTLIVKNSGTANLLITSAFVFSGPFSGSGNCPVGTLAPGASCNLNIVFKPTSVASFNGSVSIATNATASPVSVTLTGAGVSSSGPAVKLSATSLNFGTVAVGTTSASQTVTITNSGSASLSFTKSFVISSQFLGSGTCSQATPLAPGASCNLVLKFKPTSMGVKTGSVQIYSNASSSPNVISLTGTGR
jgi:parallel beta-helix repeat protein